MRFGQVIKLAKIDLQIQMGCFHRVNAVQFKNNWILINTGRGGTGLISAHQGRRSNPINVIGGFGDAEVPLKPYKHTPSDAPKAILRSMLEDGAKYETIYLDHISLTDVERIEITMSQLVVTVDPGVSFFWRIYLDKAKDLARENSEV